MADVNSIDNEYFTLIDPNRDIQSYITNPKQPYGIGKDNGDMGIDLTIPYEDLCISVDLRMDIPSAETKMTKGAFLISWKSDEAGKGYKGFFEGENGVLTARYEDFIFHKSDAIDLSEYLGIRSINIEYDSWFVPIVNIEFVDVRGVSLMNPTEYLQKSNESTKKGEGGFNAAGSFFKGFYEIPYPMFKIQVKGFYGPPVMYDLHCNDVRTTIDNTSGNVIINAKFLGFTYAFWRDLPWNYIKSSPFNEYGGKSYWKEKTEGGQLTFSNGQPLYTIPELMRVCNSAISEVDKLVADSTEIKTLNSAQSIESTIAGLESSWEEFISFLGFHFKGNIPDTNVKMLEIDKKKKIIYVNVISVKDASHEQKDMLEQRIYATEQRGDDGKQETVGAVPPYNEIRVEISTRLDSYTTLVSDSGGTSLTNGNPYHFPSISLPGDMGVVNDGVYSNPFNQKEEVEFPNNQSVIYMIKQSPNNDKIWEYHLYQDGAAEKKDTSLPAPYLPGQYKTSSYTRYSLDYKDFMSKLLEVKDNINNAVKSARQVVTDKSSQLAIDRLKFTPTIGNILRIILGHYETFFYSFRTKCIVEGIEGKPDKRKSGKVARGFVPQFSDVYSKTKDEDVQVGAFFKCIKKEGNAVVSPVHIDSGLNQSDAKQLEEIKFTKGLIESMVAYNRLMEQATNFSGGGNIDNRVFWIPINPFDVTNMALCTGLMDNNPYKPLLTKQDVVWNIGIRMYIALKCFAGDEIGNYVTALANAEAVNVYNGALKENKSLLDDFRSYIDNFPTHMKGFWSVVNGGIFKTRGLYTSDLNYSLILTQIANGNTGVLPFFTQPLSGFTKGEKQIMGDNQIYVSKESTPMLFEYQAKSNLFPAARIYTAITIQPYTANIDDIQIKLNDYAATEGVGELGVMFENATEEFRNSLWDQRAGKAVDRVVSKRSDYNPKMLMNSEGSINKYDGMKDKAYDNLVINGKDKNLSLFSAVDGKKVTWYNNPYAVQGCPVTIITEKDWGECWDQGYKRSYGCLFTEDLYYFQNTFVRAHLFLSCLRIYSSTVRNIICKGKELTTVCILRMPRPAVLLLGSIIYIFENEDAVNDVSTDMTYTKFKSASKYVDGLRQRFSDVDTLSPTCKEVLLKYFKAWVSKSHDGFPLNFVPEGSVTFENIRGYFELEPPGDKNTFSSENLISKHITYLNTKSFSSNFKTQPQGWTYCGAYYFSYRGTPDYDGNNVGKSTGGGLMETNNSESGIKIHDPNKGNGLIMLINPESNGAKKLMQFIKSEVLVSFNHYGINKLDRLDFKLEQGCMDQYLDAMGQALKKKMDGQDVTAVEEDTKTNQIIRGNTYFETTYFNLKKIHDRWLKNSLFHKDTFMSKNLFNSDKKSVIKIIDKFYYKIDDKLIMNISRLRDLLLKWDSTDMNFCGVLSDLFSANKCLFMPTAHSLDFTKVESFKEIFIPVPYLNMEPITEQQSGYTAVYIGTPSELPNSDDYTAFRNETLDFNVGTRWPSKLDNSAILDYKMPVFAVSLGKQNNQFFHVANLTNSNPVVTEQTIKTTVEIAQRANEGESAQINSGQDLYDIYSANAYMCEISMMGCAPIQPLMYFQLNNAYLFTGGYMIFKMSHSITPGKMETKFTGIRQTFTRTELTKSAFISNVYISSGN